MVTCLPLYDWQYFLSTFEAFLVSCAHTVPVEFQYEFCRCHSCNVPSHMQFNFSLLLHVEARQFKLVEKVPDFRCVGGSSPGICRRVISLGKKLYFSRSPLPTLSITTQVYKWIQKREDDLLQALLIQVNR